MQGGSEASAPVPASSTVQGHVVFLAPHLIEQMGRKEYDVTLDGAAGRNRRGGLATALQLFPGYFELTSQNRRVALAEDAR